MINNTSSYLFLDLRMTTTQVAAATETTSFGNENSQQKE
jgi:hypothetical protein